MTTIKPITIHLHATFTPTAELDGGKIAVVMGDPEVTECDCNPAPQAGTFTHPHGLTFMEPWADCKPAANSRREPVNVIINNTDGGVGNEPARLALRRIKEGGGL